MSTATMNAPATPASTEAAVTGKRIPGGKATTAKSLKGQDRMPGKGRSHGRVEGKTIKNVERQPRITVEGNNGPITITPPKDLKRDDVMELRGESKRGKLLESLQNPNGVTMGQACTRFEWKPRDFADALRLLAKYNGVTTHRDEKGHWRIVKK